VLFRSAEIYIFKVEDGKLAAATAVVEDNLTRLRQLGNAAVRTSSATPSGRITRAAATGRNQY
jgi:hypothetical protein